jgi:ribosomal protein L24
VRKSQEYPNGTIVDKPMPIHLSNVALKLAEGLVENTKGKNKNT